MVEKVEGQKEGGVEEERSGSVCVGWEYPRYRL